MSVQKAIKPITYGQLKRAIELIESKKEEELKIDLDTVMYHLNIFRKYLKEHEGIKEPTLHDVMDLIKDAPDELELMTFRALVGRPNFERATRIGAKWIANILLPELRDVDENVLDLYDGDATRYMFLKYVGKLDIPYIKWSFNLRSLEP